MELSDFFGAKEETVRITGELENGNIVVLSGHGFGARGLLTSNSGVLATDKAPARVVVLGDAPDFADCQLRYQLLAKAWTDESIFVKFDLPEELQTQSWYIFVVDDAGQPSIGFGPLLYGAGMESGQPDQPEVEN